MPGPDFFCIGAQKAGTTWLYNQLIRHPAICVPAKESNIMRRFQGLALDQAYDEFYVGCPAQRLLGEVCPVYATMPEFAAKARRHCSTATFFFLLRNPAERAFSQYKMAALTGRIDPTISFRDAFDQDLQSMQRRGRYMDVLDEFEAAFGTHDRLQLLPFEWIEERPEALLSHLSSRLGCADFSNTGVMRQVFAATVADRTISAADRLHVFDVYRTQIARLAPSLWWRPPWAQLR